MKSFKQRNNVVRKFTDCMNYFKCMLSCPQAFNYPAGNIIPLRKANVLS